MATTKPQNPNLAKILSFGRSQWQNALLGIKCEVEKIPQPKAQQQAFVRNL